MKQAVRGASKWLIEHTKSNPIPFKLFKSILDKQIEWAKNNRGITLNFGELSEAVKSELLKGGIYVISENGISNQPEHTSASLFATGEPAFSSLTLSLSDDEPTLPKFFGWLHAVFSKATANGITELQFAVKAIKDVD